MSWKSYGAHLHFTLDLPIKRFVNGIRAVHRESLSLCVYGPADDYLRQQFRRIWKVLVRTVGD